MTSVFSQLEPVDRPKIVKYGHPLFRLIFRDNGE